MAQLDPEAYARNERNKLILVAAVAGLVLGDMRYGFLGPSGAKLVALAIPTAAAARGYFQLHESSNLVRGSALVIAGLAVLDAVNTIYPVLYIGAPLLPLRTAVIGGIAMAVSACVVQGMGAARGLKNRFAAWIGIAVAYGIYLPSAYGKQDPYTAVISSLAVAVLAGGGAGLLLGAVASSVLGRR